MSSKKANKNSGNKKPRAQKTSGNPSRTKSRRIAGLALLLLSFFMFTAYVSYLFTWKADQSLMSLGIKEFLFANDIRAENFLGKTGALLAHYSFYYGFGLASFLLVYLFMVIALKLLLPVRLFSLARQLKIVLPLLVWISAVAAFFSIHFPFPLGGIFGKTMVQWLIAMMGTIGTGAILFFPLLAFIAIKVDFNKLIIQPLKNRAGKQPVTGPSSEAIKDVNVPTIVDEETEVNNWENEIELENAEAANGNGKKQSPVNQEQTGELEITNQETINHQETTETESTTEEQETGNTGPDLTIEKVTREKILDENIVEPFDPTLELSDYKFPPLDLLDYHGSEEIRINREELEHNKNRIIETLQNYNIEISKIKATVGPTVTLYEIVPAPGVRISRIKNLEDDIALSLAALGIRIIAPIPGKGTIGIEVPNEKKEIVSMRTVLASEKFQNSKYQLPVGLGKNIANEIIVADLAKMPHLLIAGATGQGKSVGVNAILMSLLYKKHPAELKFVMIDPKKVELSLFRKIENHFLAKLPGEEEPIITDYKKVLNTLNALCIEMDNRYDLLKEAHCRNIMEYNTKFIARKLNPNKGHYYLPYIVLVIDEFADLMLTSGKEAEGPITRLAQLARAVGIHLIISTQRPTVNIITGTIKANFPARIAFKVTMKVDSRTILDVDGAEQLIGRGDMLFSLGSEIVRLQCPFVDTPEVERVIDFISSQRGFPEPFYLPEYIDDKELAELDDSGEFDELFEEAARVVVINQQGSTSLIQRKLKLGYNRAGRIMDQLEASGIVGPSKGSKARDVLIPDLNSLEQFLSQLRNNSLS